MSPSRRMFSIKKRGSLSDMHPLTPARLPEPGSSLQLCAAVPSGLKGRKNSAQGKAKRRPGLQVRQRRSPERAQEPFCLGPASHHLQLRLARKWTLP
jgi:hypothetical protein